MRIPAPTTLNIGTDIISVARLTRLFGPPVERQSRFVDKILHASEVQELHRRFPQWQATKSQVQAHEDFRKITFWLAGRWAAKEAAKKAWNAHLLSWKDLRVEAEVGGNVLIICNPDSDPNTSTTSPIIEQAAKLSISHDGDYATAVVLAAPLHADILSELGRRNREAEARVTNIKVREAPS